MASAIAEHNYLGHHHRRRKPPMKYSLILATNGHYVLGNVCEGSMLSPLLLILVLFTRHRSIGRIAIAPRRSWGVSFPSTIGSYTAILLLMDFSSVRIRTALATFRR